VAGSIDAILSAAYSNEYDESDWFTHACLLLPLLLRPGAGVLFDEHGISYSIVATHDPDPPADAAGGFFIFRQQYSQTTKG
jgi:hypothetical protein